MPNHVTSHIKTICGFTKECTLHNVPGLTCTSIYRGNHTELRLGEPVHVRAHIIVKLLIMHNHDTICGFLNNVCALHIHIIFPYKDLFTAIAPPTHIRLEQSQCARGVYLRIKVVMSCMSVSE